MLLGQGGNQRSCAIDSRNRPGLSAVLDQCRHPLISPAGSALPIGRAKVELSNAYLDWGSSAPFQEESELDRFRFSGGVGGSLNFT